MDLGCFEFQSTLSTNDYYTSNVALHPNPSSSSFGIDGLESKSSICVYGIGGKKLMAIPNYDGEKIDVSFLTPGIYLVVIKNQRGKESKKLVVQ